MPDLLCPNCGASASLPLGLTCDNHQPVPVVPDPRTVEMSWTVENSYFHEFTWETWCDFVLRALGEDADPSDLDDCYEKLRFPGWMASDELREISTPATWTDNGDAEVTELEFSEPNSAAVAS